MPKDDQDRSAHYTRVVRAMAKLTGAAVPVLATAFVAACSSPSNAVGSQVIHCDGSSCPETDAVAADDVMGIVTAPDDSGSDAVASDADAGESSAPDAVSFDSVGVLTAPGDAAAEADTTVHVGVAPFDGGASG